MKHVEVYRETGRYAGWPANYGIWSWGNEVVVCFTVGYMKEEISGFHPRDANRSFYTVQARSQDGGESWKVIPMTCKVPGNKSLSADEHVKSDLGIGDTADLENTPIDCPGIDFTNPDLAIMCARSGLSDGAESWFYFSLDRCYSWNGPFKLPGFGLRGIAARTDYLVADQNTCTFFLTAAKSNGKEGRVFCAQTTDGGKTFDFQSMIGEEPDGFDIMPASLRLPDSRLLVAVRCRGNKPDFAQALNWIDLYASDNQGVSWQYLNRPVEDTGVGGNPPTLTQLKDGRLAIVYGYRDQPTGIRNVTSVDNGQTWSQPIMLREDGGDHDIGYPRTVERPDGKLVTVYYYNDQPNGERYIAATIWQP